MTKKAMVEALVKRGVEVDSKMKKAEVEAIYLEALAKVTEEETMKETKRKEAEVNVINSNEAHVEVEEHVTSLEAEEAIISVMALSDAHNAYERAMAFYRIKNMKLYECLKDEEGEACNSFKSYVNDFRGGEVYGIKYAMAMHYINLCKYVYPQRTRFIDWGTHILVALIKPLKNEETRGIVLDAIDEGIISEYMTLKEVKEALEGILGEAEETEGEASPEAEAEDSYATSNTCEVTDEAIDNAIEKMEAFLEVNAHDSEVTEAWYIILKALDR